MVSQAKVATRLVDGRTNPGAISDAVAYRFVFLSLEVAETPDSKSIERQGRQIQRIGLDGADAAVVREEIAQYMRTFRTINAQVASKHDPNASNRDLTVATNSSRSALLRRLSPSGIQKLAAFVEQAKRRMIVQQ
jgi:hypothetical protein